MKKIVLLVFTIISTLKPLDAQWLNPVHLSDMNEWTSTSGFIQWYDHQKNTPNGQTYGNGIQLLLGYDPRHGAQIVVPTFDQNIYFRRYAGGWSSWDKIWHTSNLNRSDVDFSAKNLSSFGVLQTINKDSPGAIWDNLSVWSDGENSYIYANGDEKGLHLKSNGGNKIILESNVGIGTTNPYQQLSITGGIGFANQNSIDKKLFSPVDGILEWFTHDYAGEHGFTVSHQGERRVYLNTSGNSYFTGGNLLVGKTTQTNSTYKLDVAGKIRADEIVINTTGADFVFEPTYKLRSLSELESFIKENKHLPDIAPAKEMQENGVSAGEMQTRLLQKVEELTLYLIEKDKQLEEQIKINVEQQQILCELKKEMELLKKY